jgi:hypothetical protein
VLHPDGYLACIKTLPPAWIAELPRYEPEGWDWEACGSEIDGTDSFWKNHFKERLTNDRAKIESTLNAATDWLRKQTAE